MNFIGLFLVILTISIIAFAAAMLVVQNKVKHWQQNFTTNKPPYKTVYLKNQTVTRKGRVTKVLFTPVLQYHIWPDDKVSVTIKDVTVPYHRTHTRTVKINNLYPHWYIKHKL